MNEINNFKKYCIIRIPQLVAFGLIILALYINFGYADDFKGSNRPTVALGIAVLALIITIISDVINKKIICKKN